MPGTPWPHAPSLAPAPTPARPAPDTVRLVQFCCQRLLRIEPDFAVAFHRALCELAPNLPAMTRSGGPELSGAVAHCLLWAALTRNDSASVEQTVRDFAAEHHRRGFPDDAYASVSHALLRSVRTVMSADWTSELSSGLVSHALWLQPCLEQGARDADGAGAARPSGGGEVSLELLLDDLRSRYFTGEERGFDAVCTRVMLRTGVDLRAPRPEQRQDPVVIAAVIKNLMLMGYAPGPAVTAAATARAGAARDGRGVAAASAATPLTGGQTWVQPPDCGHDEWAPDRRSWWTRRRHGD